MSEPQHTPWIAEIQYGPEGEAYYAWVYTKSRDLVGTFKTHHANTVVQAVNSHASLAEENQRLREALEAILCMHDGNPPLPLADMPEIDYARRTISSIHREAREALSKAGA